MAMELVLVAAASGALAAAAMYALLFPVARGAPLPPDLFAARLLGRNPTRGSLIGVALQTLFGVFWGSVMGATVEFFGLLGGNFVLQGLAVGIVSFGASFAGFAALGLAGPKADWREWTGHFLNHLVFGLVLGILVLASQTTRA